MRSNPALVTLVSVMSKMRNVEHSGCKTCGQYYKHFTLVNYNSRVVIWGIFQSGTTLES